MDYIIPLLLITVIIIFEIRVSKITKTVLAIGSDLIRTMVTLSKKKVLTVEDIDSVTTAESEDFLERRK